MKNKLSFLLISSVFAVSANAASTLFIEQFDGYVAGSNINGQGGWTVTNGLGVGPTFDPVAIADNIVWDSSAGSATIGGIAPDPAGVTTVSNSTVSLPLKTETAHITTVRFEFLFVDSNNGFRNNYSVLIGTGGGNLLTVALTPHATLGKYNMAWSSAFGGSGSLNQINESEPTEFTLTTFEDGGTMKYSLSNAGVPVVTAATLTGAGAVPTTTINNFSVIYDSTVGGGVGNGYLVADRIVMIPEPSSALLLGLSALGLIRRKR
jgi:PEP-CTERM motif